MSGVLLRAGRTAGREGWRSLRLSHSLVGKGVIWGTIPAPSMQHSSTVCSSTAADAEHTSTAVLEPVVPAQREGSQGVVSPQDTKGQSSLCFSTPSRTPVQGPGCPARTRTGFPELNHGLKLSPSTHRASPGLLEGIRPALNPASSRGLQKRGKEKWRGCLRRHQ